METRDQLPSPVGCRTAADLIDRMIALRRWAGQPSLRRLRMLGGASRAVDGTVIDALPPTTTSAVLRGRRAMPRLPFVERYVAACLAACGYEPPDIAVHVDQWRHVWRSLAGAEPGLPGQPESAGAAETPILPIPRQLPMATYGFAGRQAAFAALDNWLDRADTDPGSSPLVVALTGPAGIGKTALALTWGQRVAERFEDGQLYASLAGRAGTAAAAPVLARLLRTLGVGQPATDLDELAALYRSALAGKRILVVVDGVESSAQARPFLPGTPGCAAVVTGRHELSGLVVREGAHRLRLGPLTALESQQLLTGLLSSTRTDLDSATRRGLLARCHGSPLILRSAVERLVRERERGQPTRRTTTPTTRPASTYP